MGTWTGLILAQVRDGWRAVANAITNLRGICGGFSSCKRKTLIHTHDYPIYLYAWYDLVGVYSNSSAASSSCLILF